MAVQVDEHDVRSEPGLGVALLTVLGIIVTMAVLGVLIWVLMVAVAETTAGRHQQGVSAVPAGPLIDQKAVPAKQP